MRPFAWESVYPPGLSWDAPLHTGSIPAELDAAAAEHPDRTIFHFRDQALTYADLRTRADRFAAALIAEGQGVPVALYLPNTPFHPIAFFGALRAGRTVVHLSPLDAAAELAHKLRDSGARTIVTTNVAGMLSAALKLKAAGLADRVIACEDADWGEAPIEREVITSEAILFDTLQADPPAYWPAIDPGKIALIQYTGGTTGLPKGAILTHANLTAAVSAYDHWFAALYGAPQGTERILLVLPLFHIYALTSVMLLGIRRRAEFVLHMRFDATRVLADIERYRITSFPGVPTMWIALANHPDLMRHDLSSLTRCASGGAPLPVEVGQRLERLLGKRLAGGWGMTETSPAGTNLLPFGDPKPGSIGIPLPGIEMRVVSLEDSVKPLPPNEIGELAIRGANVTQGYWNRPEANDQAFADGYFLTGDIGYMSDDGWFYIVERKHDMILSGGFNVYPQMIEQAIYTHPAVAECIVIGIPDAYRGEAAKAFVVLKGEAPRFTCDDLRGFLADKLGRHELPAALEFRTELPRTPVGKLSRKELRAEEAAKSALTA